MMKSDSRRAFDEALAAGVSLDDIVIVAIHRDSPFREAFCGDLPGSAKEPWSWGHRRTSDFTDERDLKTIADLRRRGFVPVAVLDVDDDRAVIDYEDSLLLSSVGSS